MTNPSVAQAAGNTNQPEPQSSQTFRDIGRDAFSKFATMAKNLSKRARDTLVPLAKNTGFTTLGALVHCANKLAKGIGKLHGMYAAKVESIRENAKERQLGKAREAVTKSVKSGLAALAKSDLPVAEREKLTQDYRAEAAQILKAVKAARDGGDPVQGLRQSVNSRLDVASKTLGEGIAEAEKQFTEKVKGIKAQLLKDFANTLATEGSFNSKKIPALLATEAREMDAIVRTSLKPVTSPEQLGTVKQQLQELYKNKADRLVQEAKPKVKDDLIDAWVAALA